MARLSFLVLILTSTSYVTAALTSYLQLMSAPNTANGMLRDSTTIKGITGSNDLLGAIEVQDWSMGITQTPTQTSPGKPVFQNFSFTKRIDGNTPVFAQYIEQGTVLSKGFVLTVVTPAGTSNAYARGVYSFGNALIVSQQLTGGDGDSMTEVITVAFGLAGITFNSQSPTGALAKSYSQCWIIPQNIAGTACYTGTN